MTTQSLPVPASIETPALVVDVDVLTRNLDAMVAHCRRFGVALAPHAKTHRTPQIGLLQIERGAHELCVAKLGEAEAFADAGVERLTVAYPLVGADKLRRAARLSQRAALTLATDSVEAGRAIGAHFAAEGRTADVLLIVDTGLGRCGVAPAEAPDIAARIDAADGVRVRGVMTHEGHVYGAHDRAELEALSRATAELMVRTGRAIRDRGVDATVVSPGASASARFAAEVEGVTQVRPGIFAFNDLGQIALGNADFGDCAVRVVATVVSRPEPRRACIDAGSKTLSQDRLPASGMGSGFEGFGLLADLPGWRIEKLSEEHGWLRWHAPGEPGPLAIGQRVQVIPNHVCTVFSSLGESVAVRGGEIEAVWRTIGPGASR